MKTKKTLDTVKCIEIKCKKTTNSVPAFDAIEDSADAAKFARGFYHDDINIYESFFLILMNVHNKPIAWAKVAQGGIDAVGIDIMILAKYVVDSLAKNVILVHNHPSGNITPSKKDRILTEKVIQALDLLGARVKDHIILTENNYYSFHDNGIV